MDIQTIVVRPVITEKSIAEATNGKFTFEVLKSANKDVVKIAVEKMFKVNVTSVATTMVKGRSHRTGVKRFEITKRPWKKAVVRVKKGQKIDLFEVAGETK